MPQGSTILSASLGITADDKTLLTYPVYSKLRFEDADSPTTFSTAADWNVRFPTNMTTA